MKSSNSWQGFDIRNRVNSKLETISLLYSYNLIDSDFPDEVKYFLLSLEEKLGGNRYPIVSGRGDNFLSPVTPAIGLAVSFVVAPFIRKYLDGLLNGDALKEAGISHREEIASWFPKLEKDLATIIAITNDLLKDYPNAIVCRRQKTELMLKVDLGSNQLRVALSRYHSDEVRAMIPGNIVKAVKYIVENQLEENLGDFRLQYNYQSKEWCMHVTSLVKLPEKG